jgi:hypothetical protein
LFSCAGQTAGAAGTEDIGIASAAIRRIEYDPANPAVMDSLPPAVTVLQHPPLEQRALVAALRGESSKLRPRLPAGAVLYVLGTGPVLDQPDQVEVRSLDTAANHFSLQVVYTSARLEGTQLRRNTRWRPVIQLPLTPGLAPGVYEIAVNWRAVPRLKSEDFHAHPAITTTLTFDVK